MTIIKPNTAFPTGANWPSASSRGYHVDQTPLAVDTVADVRNNDFEGARWLFVKAAGAIYRLDLSSSAADDGATCIHDNVSRRYVRVTLGGGLALDAVGAEADLSDHDDEAAGFVYGVTDQADFQIYVKASATSADWAGPFPWRGAAGADGLSAGTPFTFSTTTTMADPGAGAIRFNNATLASVTALAIDDLSAAGGNPSVAAWLSALAGSDSAVKGHVVVTAREDDAIFAIFALTAVSADSGWKQATVTHVASAGTFTNGMAVQFAFARTGDKGDTGAQGPQGATGLSYAFSATTTMADPGAGGLRFDHATLGAVTQIAISGQSDVSGNPSVADIIGAWDQGVANVIKGRLVVETYGAPENAAHFDVTGITDETGWYTLDVTPIAASGTISGDVAVLFVPAANAADALAYSATATAAASDAADSANAAAEYAASASFPGKSIASREVLVDGIKGLAVVIDPDNPDTAIAGALNTLFPPASPSRLLPTANGAFTEVGANTHGYPINPATGERRGFALAKTLISQALNSCDLSQSNWVKTAMETVTLSGTSPIPGKQWSRLQPTTTNTSHHVRPSINATSGKTYTLVGISKAAGYDNMVVYNIADFTDAIRINLSTLAITTAAGSPDLTKAGAVSLGNGAVLWWYTSTASATTTVKQVYLDSDSSAGVTFAGNGSAIEFALLSVIEGDAPATIVTTSAAATLDEAVVEMTDIPVGSTYGTLFVQIAGICRPGAGVLVEAFRAAAPTVDRIAIETVAGALSASVKMTGESDKTQAGATTTAAMKIACSWNFETDQFLWSVNGASQTAITLTGSGAALDSIALGPAETIIADFRAAPVALTQSQLNALTV